MLQCNENVKKFFKNRNITVSVQTLTTKGKTERPIWIQVYGNMPNDIRLRALKSTNTDLNSVLNLEDIHDRAITDNRIALNHEQWATFLSSLGQANLSYTEAAELQEQAEREGWDG